MANDDTPRGIADRPDDVIYGELADWWPLLSSAEHYLEEAHAYRALLLDAGDAPLRTVLELGSGGGGNASHLKLDFSMTLVDRAPGMLGVSRALNPECEHVLGDMRTVRLDRMFDAVFVHDAVSYMTSLDDLAAAVRTAFVHCRPGGVALFAPDALRETFRETTNCGGNEDGARALRYLQWLWDPDPTDDTYVADWVCLLREGRAISRTVYERHVFGLFARADWLRILADAGFVARARPFVHSQVEPGSLEVFVARRPR
ncbi:class I SAM-dependent methyltransferase [Candidatus Binatia bacterium]|jgi:SAM-dependent methyltransferase|nr:class I SAM-dependent methyltransferase [Candidatus Binatia bacterium]